MTVAPASRAKGETYGTPLTSLCTGKNDGESLVLLTEGSNSKRDERVYRVPKVLGQWFSDVAGKFLFLDGLRGE